MYNVQFFSQRTQRTAPKRSGSSPRCPAAASSRWTARRESRRHRRHRSHHSAMRHRRHEESLHCRPARAAPAIADVRRPNWKRVHPGVRPPTAVRAVAEAVVDARARHSRSAQLKPLPALFETQWTRTRTTKKTVLQVQWMPKRR